MRRWKSVRVRVTVLATAIVAAALVLASVLLVLSLENTLAGRAKNSAEDLVRTTADDLRSGMTTNPGLGARAIREGVIIQVRNERNEVVRTIPGPPEGIGSTYQQKFDETDPLTASGAASGGSFASSERMDVLDPGDELTTTYVEGDGSVLIRRVELNDNIIVQERVGTPSGEFHIVATTPLAEVARSIDPVVRALQFGTPVLIALVALVTWWITGRALRPIETLRREADSISHSSDGASLPVPNTADEVERLAITLNDMLLRIDESSRRQQEFVSDASHELRSPITSMHVALEVASLHPETTSVQDLSKELLLETTRMQNMVNALLALARMEERGFTPPAIVDLAPALSRATGEPVSEQLAEADEEQIESAVRNLVDNARRHARTSVDVAIERTDGDLIVTVDDDGPGVPDDQRERIFDRFTRLDTGRARTDGGAGIGLALARRIAERHHGTITVGTSPLGGARFTLRLPLRQPS
jgi:signal transduction histidine kinase